MPKICTGCKLQKPEDEFDRRVASSDGRNARCKVCTREFRASPEHTAYRRSYYALNRHKEAAKYRNDPAKYKDRNLRSRYGISLEDYNTMLSAQCGACAICCVSSPDQSGTRKYFIVDHCHITGAVRGLLCQKCNAGLGLFNDSPTQLKQAVEYLTSSKLLLQSGNQ